MRVQPVVAVVVGIVLATTLVSGPLVSAVDLTAEGSLSDADIGDGRVTVGDVTLPDRVVFERGEFGSGSYYLRVPPATAELGEIVGRPIISYQLSIDELGFTTSTVKVLSRSNEGTIELEIDDSAFARDRFENETFTGRLVVDVRYGGRERVIASKNVTIEVVG